MTRFPRIAAWIIPTLLWLWVFWYLDDEWTLNPNYNYGWAVPVLGAFLFYLRWADRPLADAISGSQLSVARITRWVLLALLLPVRVIEEATPDWRLLGWIMALIAVCYSLLIIWECGGLSWVKHFAFPIFFPLVAVPWLVQIENLIVQNLARAVAAIAVEIVGWTGVAAFRLGNVIELPDGFVGIDDACSGVKTLQAAIMVTLFLGELLRLPSGRRVALVVAGCLWVVVCNTFRATALVSVAARGGVSSLGRWHDLIGTIVLVAGMGGLVLIALLLRTQRPEMDTARRAMAPRLFSTTETWVAVAWLVVISVGTELWYRQHEHGLVTFPKWQIHWPQQNQRLPIAESTRTILRYDEATTATWEDDAGNKWWGFFARWEPKRTALQLVRSHSPDICLPATGRTFKRELSPVQLRAAGVDLIFRMYEFEQNQRPLFVFVSVRDDKSASKTDDESLPWNARGRLLSAWQGKRNLGQRLVEVAVSGLDDPTQARAAAKRTLSELLAVD